MQNMGRWGLRDHPLEKCVEKMPSADCRQAGYLRTFRRHPIRAFFAHEKAAHFSSEWASKGRRRSFFHRMGARGNGAVRFSDGWAPDGPEKSGSFASGRPDRSRRCISEGSLATHGRCSPRAFRGSRLRARRGAGKSAVCCGAPILLENLSWPCFQAARRGCARNGSVSESVGMRERL